MRKHNLNLRRIDSDSHKEVQSILDTAPTYYMKVEGVLKIDGAAKKVFEELPPLCTYDDKYVFFIEKNETPIGVVDLIIGYPNRKTAFLGLLLLGEKYHGSGIGRESYDLIENYVKQFNIDSIQLAVNDSNDIGMRFWLKLGFKVNGRTRLNEGLKVTSTAHVMEKFI
jgi:RimJ/RimL family protein N-acetyltransferase